MTLEEIIRTIRTSHGAHKLAEGATDLELQRIEENISLSIPREYREFLQFSNGAILYETEELLGTRKAWELAETIPEAIARLRNSGRGKLPKGLLPFHSGLPGRYTCFDTGRIGPSGKTLIVEWVEEEGLLASVFDSFEDWFKQVLYDEYQARYS